jgi:hypothetical protein
LWNIVVALSRDSSAKGQSTPKMSAFKVPSDASLNDSFGSHDPEELDQVCAFLNFIFFSSVFSILFHCNSFLDIPMSFSFHFSPLSTFFLTSSFSQWKQYVYVLRQVVLALTPTKETQFPAAFEPFLGHFYECFLQTPNRFLEFFSYFWVTPGLSYF